MNVELTELVFILDRSGSMNGLESDTIGGFNGISIQKMCKSLTPYIRHCKVCYVWL